MLVQEKIGHIGSFDAGTRRVDVLAVEWYETGKRILRKATRGGVDVAMRFLKEGMSLTEGDILYVDEGMVIVVEILPCDTLVIPMASMAEVAAVCYETGNRHLPLYREEDELLVPFDAPLYRWLAGGGYAVKQEMRKLLYPLRTTVAGHVHAGGGLLSKILSRV